MLNDIVNGNWAIAEKYQGPELIKQLVEEEQRANAGK